MGHNCKKEETQRPHGFNRHNTGHLLHNRPEKEYRWLCDMENSAEVESNPFQAGNGKGGA
jgi:hypothetical protein